MEDRADAPFHEGKDKLMSKYISKYYHEICLEQKHHPLSTKT